MWRHSLLKSSRAFTTIRRSFCSPVEEQVQNFIHSKEYFAQIRTIANLQGLVTHRNNYKASKGNFPLLTLYIEALDSNGFHREANQLISLELKKRFLSSPYEAFQLLRLRRKIQVEGELN